MTYLSTCEDQAPGFVCCNSASLDSEYIQAWHITVIEQRKDFPRYNIIFPVNIVW